MFWGSVSGYGVKLEDFGWRSLKNWIDDRNTLPLSLEEFLKIAIKITESLGNIHSNNIIHQDINQANIVVKPETGEVKLIDFGISSKLTRENPTLKHPKVLEGTLAYISPEQTGRMNRFLDYGTEAQNRFNFVFQSFIRCFGAPEHPLVIFIDYLQWADSASLKLIELIMADVETKYLFLIGAYRDNEVSRTHRLTKTIEELR